MFKNNPTLGILILILVIVVPFLIYYLERPRSIPRASSPLL